jgi:hypothetical protein
LPKRFGNWHTIYTRMNRWAKAGVLDRLFAELQREQLIRIKIEAVSLDSTIGKVHPDGTGAQKNAAHKPSANPGDGPPALPGAAMMSSGASTLGLVRLECLSLGQSAKAANSRRSIESLVRTAATRSRGRHARAK